MNWKTVIYDIGAALTPAGLVVAEQLQKDGFAGINWAGVVAAAIGGVITFFRMSPGDPRRTQ